MKQVKDGDKIYIKLSHERCRENGLNTNALFSARFLSGDDLQKRLEDKKELVLISTHFMNQLYNFVKGTDFFAILTDEEGCILNVIGDDKILSEAFELRMVPGAFMDENNIGTNAMSVVITEGIPVQVSGKEHYIKGYHKWTCSAAPICDQEGNIIGILDLTGYIKNVHPHTLGMVTAAANAIEKMLQVNHYIHVLTETKKERKLAGRILSGQAIYTFDKIIGKNKRFLEIVDYAKKIADSTSTVLLMGESGTGKEIFSQSIHNHSSRRDEPFVAVNCGAIPRTLIESELFGYEEGAFTGAKKGGVAGKFELADGGTIFLDEIGEMPLDMQIKLLRVIEEGVLTRIGSSKPSIVNVRIIAATNKDLKIEVEKGNFRKDLFYRLNVLPIILPSLRDRKEDIESLIDYYMSKTSKRLNKRRPYLSEAQINKLVNYDWPGNIRELENFIERTISTESMNLELWDNGFEEDKNAVSLQPNLTLEEMEKQYITRVLKEYKGNVSLAAQCLEIGRNTLYRKLKKFNIDCSIFEQSSIMEQ